MIVMRQSVSSGSTDHAAGADASQSEHSASSSNSSALSIGAFERDSKHIELIPVSIVKAMLDKMPTDERSTGETLLRAVKNAMPIQQFYSENADIIRCNTIPFHLTNSFVATLEVEYAPSDLPGLERRYATGPSLFKLRPKQLRAAACFGLYYDFDLYASEPVAFEHRCGLAGLDCTELTGEKCAGRRTPRHTPPLP